MNLIFLGPPGAGKGTVAAIIKEKLGLVHISTGDLFRDNIKKETPLGKKVKEILASGGLVGDDITCQMVRERLKQDDCKNGFILDGFPRTIPQADDLQSFAHIDAAIEFAISTDEVVTRLSGRRVCPSTGKIYHVIFNPPKKEGFDDETGEALIQRDDDKEDAIKHRLEVYHSQTEPLIAYYKEKGLLKSFDASASSKNVADGILALAK